MSKELKAVLFGTGGYAANYLEAFKNPQRENVRLAGAVDPYAKDFTFCPLYQDAETMFRETQPHIAIIGTPIQFHAEQAELAFAHGCHVVLEKPIAATVESARAMLYARDRAGKMLNVDYQLCYTPAVRAAKADADAGLFGAPVRLKALVLWPRERSYFQRGSGWAGKKTDGEGRPIYDSVLNNATAHYLMNMLFMTGAPAENIECATFRANPVETYDTAVMRGTSAGAEIFIAVSHALAPSERLGPVLEYRYERATLRWTRRTEESAPLTAYFDDGRVKEYGPVKEPYMINLWNMVDAIREGKELMCTGETALLETMAIQAMREIQPDAVPFPEAWVQRDETIHWVPGLAAALRRCFEEAALPDWDFSQSLCV
ncbi:MAG: Gfo/Idh/MocA family oxidoreductase [Clostridia bacterium]|nr:Gfo/Idh/MocA family oxidoreductase [Clostridia bacterium]